MQELIWILKFLLPLLGYGFIRTKRIIFSHQVVNIFYDAILGELKSSLKLERRNVLSDFLQFIVITQMWYFKVLHVVAPNIFTHKVIHFRDLLFVQVVVRF